MVDQLAVVTKTITGTGNVDFTDPSITGTCTGMLLIYSATATDNADNAHAIMGMGFVAPDPGAGTQEQSTCIRAQNGQNTTPNCGTIHSTINGITVTNETGTTTVAAIYDSQQAGGIRLNVTTFTITSIKVTAVLFAISNSYTDNVTSSTSSAHKTTGGTTNFRANAIIFNAADTALSGATNDAAPGLGFAVDTAGPPQVSAYISADDATEPSDADGIFSSAAAFTTARSRSAGALVVGTSTISSFDSTGFNHQATVASTLAHLLALKFAGNVRVACANLSVAAATGQQVFNAFGFTPDLVIGMGTLLTSVDSNTDGATASCSCYFITGRYASRAIAWHHQENLTLAGAVVAVAHTRQEDVAVLQYDHLGNIVQRATWLGASGSGGFILDFSVGSQAGTLTALGIQLVPNPPLPIRRLRRPRRARARYRRRRVFIGGRVVGPPPLLRGFWKAIARIRRAAIARMRWRPVILNVTPPVATITTESPKGRICSPGLLRGRIVGPAMHEPEEDT